MFKFFRRKRAKNNWNSSMDLYELNEQEAEMLMGGSPVRHLIGGQQDLRWQQNTPAMRFEGTNYQPFPVVSPQPPWQQPPSWVQQFRTSTYNEQAFPSQSMQGQQDYGRQKW